MARKKKVFKIVEKKHSTFGSDVRTYNTVGALEDLVKAFSYTLEVGDSWSYEKGNKKINRNPKSISSLVKNLYNAKNNAAANGYSGSYYESVEPTKEEVEAYWAKVSE